MKVVFIGFSILFILTLLQKGVSSFVLGRSKEEWFLDLSGLFMQGVIIPVLQTVGVYVLFFSFFPGWQHVISLSSTSSFLLSFLGIDYLYYWNHRLLHQRSLWPFHQVHHTPEHLDLLVTSRNSLLTPFLLVYLWANGLFIYLLSDPTSYLLGMSLTAVLDLWRHSGFTTEPPFLSKILITPRLHTWHHSRGGGNSNFGANLVLWDMLHGTYETPPIIPGKVGIPLNLSIARKLFFPFPKEGK